MNKKYVVFCKQLLQRLNYTPICDDWIKNVKHITLSKEEAKWIKAYHRVSKIARVLSKMTEMDIELSIEANRRVLTLRNESRYIYRTTLKKVCHWTDEDIKRLYPTASRYCRNKHYSSGPYVELYRLSLVEKYEEEDKELKERLKKYQSKEWIEQAEKRSLAAKKAVETRAKNQEEKLDNIRDEIYNLEIEVDEYDDMDELVADACHNYNSIACECGRYESCAPVVPFSVAKEDFLQKNNAELLEALLYRL